MSLNKSSNIIDDPANFSANQIINRDEIIPVGAIGPGCVTLTVLNRNYNVHDVPVELHVRRRTVTNHREDFCAIFNFPGVRDGLPFPSVLGEITREAYIPLRESPESHLEQSVFVPVCKVAQDRQERRKVWMWSIVRLRSLDCCLNWIANRPEIVPVINHSIESFPSVRNGELESFLMDRGVRRSFMHGNSKNEMVKGRAEIVKCVRDNERPSLERREFVNPEDKTVSGAISIAFLKDAVRVSVRPGDHFILDGLYMFLAPRKLCANTGKV